MERLTKRELAVLGLVAAGRRNREIAEALHLGVYTVSRVRSRVVRKLGATDMAHAVAIGIREHLIEAA